MPSQTAASRPSRTRPPGRVAAGKGKDDVEEVSNRSTALSPNRSVASPAPVGGEADQVSPYSRRDRIKKRVSDEAVGGIESLIPKARKQQPGPVSPYAQRGSASCQSGPKAFRGTDVAGLNGNGGSNVVVDADMSSPATAARRGRKSTKSDVSTVDSPADDAPMSEITLGSPVMTPMDSSVVRFSPQKATVVAPVLSVPSQSKGSLLLDEQALDVSASAANCSHLPAGSLNGEIAANRSPSLDEQAHEEPNGHTDRHTKASNGDVIPAGNGNSADHAGAHSGDGLLSCATATISGGGSEREEPHTHQESSAQIVSLSNDICLIEETAAAAVSHDWTQQEVHESLTTQNVSSASHPDSIISTPSVVGVDGHMSDAHVSNTEQDSSGHVAAAPDGAQDDGGGSSILDAAPADDLPAADSAIMPGADVAMAAATTSMKRSRFVMWTPVDDLLLRHGVENGLSFASIVAEMPFTCKFTIKDLEARWYSILYDAEIAAEAASEMITVEYGFNFKSAKKMQPTTLGARPQARFELASDLLPSNPTPESAASHSMIALVSPAGPAGQALAAVDGVSCHYLVYKSEFSIGRRVPGCEELPTAADIDLNIEGNAGRVSRKHAVVRKDIKGMWSLTNVGKRIVHVNGTAVASGGRLDMPLRALLVVCGLRLTFVSR